MRLLLAAAAAALLPRCCSFVDTIGSGALYCGQIKCGPSRLLKSYTVSLRVQLASLSYAARSQKLVISSVLSTWTLATTKC